MARHDWETSDLLLRENGYADIIIYHVHQAMEKILKAYFAKYDQVPEKIHNLDKLLDSAMILHPDLALFKREVLAVHEYYPKIRYSLGEHLDRADALDARDHLQVILSKLNIS